MFSSDVNVNKFLENVLNHDKVHASWTEFNVKLIYMHQLLEKSEEFGEFAKEVSFARNFPDTALNLEKVFDLYCNYYIKKYNELIDRMFNDLNDPNSFLEREDYIIKSRSSESDIKKGSVFKAVNNLLEEAIVLDSEKEDADFAINDEDDFVTTAEQIKLIEAKIFGIMKTAKITDPNDLLNLDKSKKIYYFFAAFMSPALRKKRNSSVNDSVPFDTDELGNLQICSQVEDKMPNLAHLISNYYMKKDRCVYIQVGDTLYQLDKNENTFKFKNLPIFENQVMNFRVNITVSNAIDEISLHIIAIEPKEIDAKFAHVSLIQKDSNFIEKKMKKHIIALKK